MASLAEHKRRATRADHAPVEDFTAVVDRLVEMAEALAPDAPGPEKAARVAEQFGHDYVRELKADGTWQAFCDRVIGKVTPDDVAEMKANGSWGLLERQHERTQADHEAHVRSLTRHTVPTRHVRPRARGAGRPGARRTTRSRASPATSDPDSDSDEPGPGSGLAGPSPRFSRPWRPVADRRLAEAIAALDRLPPLDEGAS